MKNGFWSSIYPKPRNSQTNLLVSFYLVSAIYFPRSWGWHLCQLKLHGHMRESAEKETETLKVRKNINDLNCWKKINLKCSYIFVYSILTKNAQCTDYNSSTCAYHLPKTKLLINYYFSIIALGLCLLDWVSIVRSFYKHRIRAFCR